MSLSLSRPRGRVDWTGVDIVRINIRHIAEGLVLVGGGVAPPLPPGAGNNGHGNLSQDDRLSCLVFQMIPPIFQDKRFTCLPASRDPLLMDYPAKRVKCQYNGLTCAKRDLMAENCASENVRLLARFEEGGRRGYSRARARPLPV